MLHFEFYICMNCVTFFSFLEQYKTVAGKYAKQPVIFNIDGRWSDRVDNATDKDGLVHEEVQQEIYNNLNQYGPLVEDVIATTDVNLAPRDRPANVTIFMSASDYTRQIWLQKYLPRKRFAECIEDYRVTSKYVSDIAPSSLNFLEINATFLKLSWKFTLQEKLSPFQGFSVFYSTSRSVWENVFEATTTQGEIGNLQPYTDYQFRVAPRHLVGLGLISDGISVKTKEWVPSASPRSFKVTGSSSTSLAMTWNTVRNDDRNGIIVAYKIAVLDEVKNDTAYIEIPSSNNSYVKDGLEKHHPYCVKIAAVTSVGRGVWSKWIRKETLEDAPSSSPGNFTGTSYNSESITFTWNEDPSDWNSLSIKYFLSCCDNGITCNLGSKDFIRCCNVTEVTCFNRTISGGQTNFTLGGLKSLMSYNCSMLVFNSHGLGPSSWVNFMTGKAEYSKSFLNVTVTTITTHSVSLQWNYTRPIGQVSSLRIQYYCSSCERENLVHLHVTHKNSTILDNLMANQWYNIYVYEFFDGKIVRNSSVVLDVKTAEDVPPSPQNITLWSMSSTSLSVQWSTPNYPGSGLVLGYDIVLLDSVAGTSQNFTNHTEKSILLKGLKKYHNYSVKVAAFTAVGQGMFTPWSNGRTLEDVPSGSAENLTVKETSNLSLLVTWAPIPPEDRNGVILGYDLTFLDHLTSLDKTVRLHGSDQLMYEMSGVGNYYDYSISLFGRTSVGVSSKESWVSISNFGKGS